MNRDMGAAAKLWVFLAASLAVGALLGAIETTGLFSSTTASWAQAIGTIGAIAGAWYATNQQARAAAALELARRRSNRRQLAVRALGLAHVAHNRLATTRDLIRNDTSLPVLKDLEVAIEADRIAVSAFPIWELDRGDAMIAFSAFPGLLAFVLRAIRAHAAVLEPGGVTRIPNDRELQQAVSRAVNTSDQRGKDLQKALQGYLDHSGASG